MQHLKASDSKTKAPTGEGQGGCEPSGACDAQPVPEGLTDGPSTTLTHWNVQITRLGLMHCSKKKPFLQHKATHKAKRKGDQSYNVVVQGSQGTNAERTNLFVSRRPFECLNTGLNGSKVCVNRKCTQWCV
jgi:hypothetical protein